MDPRLEVVITRLQAMLDRVETSAAVSNPATVPDWSIPAHRWYRDGRSGTFEPITNIHDIDLSGLLGIDRQKAAVVRNTEQFLAGYPANDVLLWGSRGTGKSSLVKALLNDYWRRGLRMIEVAKDDLVDLYKIVRPLAGCPERFIIFCDDLSFEAGQPEFKALKATLDGSIGRAGNNVLIYATSNRRHLMPEFHAENLETRHTGGEIHFPESVEEKISLSERFGLWLAFHPFDQVQYLAIVEHWLAALGDPHEGVGEYRETALRWALTRGSRSGRVAWQFAKDWIGKRKLSDLENPIRDP